VVNAASDEWGEAQEGRCFFHRSFSALILGGLRRCGTRKGR
jgi:hypothetical protein